MKLTHTLAFTEGNSHLSDNDTRQTDVNRYSFGLNESKETSQPPLRIPLLNINVLLCVICQAPMLTVSL